MMKPELTFWEHLVELRKRLLIAIISVGIASVLCYIYAEEILKFLVLPLKGKPLYFISPTEGIMVYIKVALYSGIVLSTPVWLYQVWAFVSPALFAKERKIVLSLTFWSIFLFLCGACFCWFLFMPFALKFLLSITSEIQPMITIGYYTSFAITFVLAFGIIFQMPLVVFFLVRAGIVSWQFLWKGQRYALVLAFILGALVTPTPDIFNQAALSIPIFLLYEISLCVAYFFRKKASPLRIEN